MQPQPISLSVIVPVHNNSRDLKECLSAIKAASLPNTEIIVVDDASTDDTFPTASGSGVRTLRLEKNSGAAAARNYGARHARGEVLFFVDADVVIPLGAVKRVIEVFEENPALTAVFGSYDAAPRAKGTVSQYRNLLHHFVHQNGKSEASTFWAGCGAIRRTVFEKVGGFAERRYRHPSIEDIELGYRLRQAGHRIRLDKSLQVTHLKKWTIGSIIRTDITRRAVPWVQLILAGGEAPDDLNLKVGQRLSGLLVMSACLLALLGLFWFRSFALSFLALIGVIALNRDLYKFFWKQRGFLFAAACVPLHFLYYLNSTMGFLYVWIGFQLNPAKLLDQWETSERERGPSRLDHKKLQSGHRRRV
jgi:GT2 family glycosyltransferase